MAASFEVQEIFVDGLQSVSAHNGVIRVQLFSIAPDGSAKPAVVLLLPQSQLKSVVEGLAKSLR
jgi:hypothetical protein